MRWWPHRPSKATGPSPGSLRDGAPRANTSCTPYTVGQQSTPEQWLHVGWPILFNDGREPYTASSTAIRCGSWHDYRDPAGLWQRPYVASANHTELALARLIPAQLSAGIGCGIDAGWLDPMLSRYYAAWPFVEYGLFLGLCYAVREALGDTIAFSIAFQAGDRMRHLQDIVHLMFDLAETREGFTDSGARDAWMTDPVLVPAHENIERIVSCRDWFEIVVAVNLVFEPIVGRLMKTEFLARSAPRHGDVVSPLVLASANADTERHRAATAELVRLVLADPSHGDANRAVLAGWLDTWTAESIRAAAALAPVQRRGQRDDRQLPVPGPGRPAGPAGRARARGGRADEPEAGQRPDPSREGRDQLDAERGNGGRGRVGPRTDAGRGRGLPGPLLQDRAGWRAGLRHGQARWPAGPRHRHRHVPGCPAG